MTTTIPGEEWRLLDEASRHYDPRTFSADLDAAQDRIRRIRMRDVRLAVRDRSGRPVPNLALEVVQTRSAFPWGEQQWGLSTLNRFNMGDTDRVRHYTWRFTDCLNAANCLTYWTERPQNDGPKHEEFQGEPKIDEFAWQVDWALKNGLLAKGHPLFWSLPKAVPEWIKRYPYETQMKFLEVRIRNLTARFKGKVKIWDAINEPMWEAAFRNLPKRHWPHLEDIDAIADYIEPVLRWCREEDPDATYVINDYGMEVDPPGRELRAKDGTLVTAKLQRHRFLELFRRLADRGTPADALGMQSHTGGWVTPAEQNAYLDDFATCGLPLHFTEFWASTDHLAKAGLPPQAIEQMKAEYVANVITIAFAHPAVEAFFFWGAIGGEMGFRSDHNSGGLPSSSNQPTAVYHRVRQLLRERWWTRERVVTDGEGRATVRAFFGDHSVRYQTVAGSVAGVPLAVTPQQDGEATIVVHRPR